MLAENPPIVADDYNRRDEHGRACDDPWPRDRPHLADQAASLFCESLVRRAQDCLPAYAGRTATDQMSQNETRPAFPTLCAQESGSQTVLRRGCGSQPSCIEVGSETGARPNPAGV